MKVIISEIRLVFSGLMSRKGRSLLTILGIVIGVAGVIIIIALGAGAQNLVLGQITKIGTNLLSVQPGKSNEKGPPAQIYGIVVTTLVQEDAEALRNKSKAPHIVEVNSLVRGTGTVTRGNISIDTNIVGTEYTYPMGYDIEMESGTFFDSQQDRGNANVVVLGYSVAEDLFIKYSIDPLGQVIKVKNASLTDAGGIPLRVIGVIKKRGSAFFQDQDDQIFMPLEICQKQLLGIRHLQMIGVKVDSADNINETRDDIKTILNQRHRVLKEQDEDYTVRSLADAIGILTTITDALRLFLTAMAAIALIVGGIGILNIMLVTVAERTREIGLRKAIGATNSKIRNQFLLESALLTFFGGIVGIILGVLVSYLAYFIIIQLGYDWAFVISPYSVVLAVGVSILTGVIFGLYPAFKAAKLNPIDALRYE